MWTLKLQQQEKRTQRNMLCNDKQIDGICQKTKFIKYMYNIRIACWG